MVWGWLGGAQAPCWGGRGAPRGCPSFPSGGRRSGDGRGLISKSCSWQRAWASTPCRTGGRCGSSRMTRARCGRQTCASSPSSALWRTSGRCTATSSSPASSRLAATTPSSRMASSPCGRTARTSVAGAGSSRWPSSSGTPSWTVSGWRRCCASSGRCLTTTVTRCAGLSSTSAPRGTRLPSGPGTRRTRKGSPTSGASTRSTWACRRR